MVRASTVVLVVGLVIALGLLPVPIPGIGLGVGLLAVILGVVLRVLGM